MILPSSYLDFFMYLIIYMICYDMILIIFTEE